MSLGGISFDGAMSTTEQEFRTSSTPGRIVKSRRSVKVASSCQAECILKFVGPLALSRGRLRYMYPLGHSMLQH